MLTTTYVYDDPEHPDRPTATIASPSWSQEDQALLMGLQAYEAQLCRCNYPRSLAWHSDMDGDFDPGEQIQCHACTAQSDDGKPVYHRLRPVMTRDFDAKPLSPFVLGVTTVGP